MKVGAVQKERTTRRKCKPRQVLTLIITFISYIKESTFGASSVSTHRLS